ncbi:MAG: hypothetical protein H6929_00950 [Rhodoferax sp.]|nr:hypothetical protein [Rhodoferax sp.]
MPDSDLAQWLQSRSFYPLLILLLLAVGLLLALLRRRRGRPPPPPGKLGPSHGRSRRSRRMR